MIMFRHLLFALSIFVPVLVHADVPIIINSNWLLKSSQNLPDTGEAISSQNYPTNSWMKAQVPGTVLNTYVLNGLYPEPYYGLNNKLTRDHGKLTQGLIPDASVPGSVFSYPHWFRTTFQLPASAPDKLVWLNFSAINWMADVFVNGQLVGSIKGAFTRAHFNISAQAHPGPNTLAVKIYPLEHPGMPSDAGCGGDRSIGDTPATIYQNVNWDCTIIDGVRDRSIGIYRPVTITTSGPVTIRDPFIMTEGVPTENEARLGFKTFLVNNSSTPQTGRLKLESDGITAEKAISLAPGEQQEIVLHSADNSGLTVTHPRLWWPVGRGDPNLYSAHVSFTLDSGSVSDQVDTHFGIRSIEHELFHGQNVYKVNGHRMFLAGGAWLQDAMLRTTPERYDAQARLIARAGFNWLRIWSGSGVEADEFFDACDKYGILVWVESGLTAQTDSPWRQSPDYKQCTLDNWQDSVLRVRSHPSVFYYCGCNEGGDVPGMSDIVKKYDGTRDYQGSSQDNGQRGSPYRYQGVNCLYDYTGVDLFGAGHLGVFGGFCNESGNPCLPAIESMRQFIPENKLWPINDDYFNYHDGGGFHQVLKMIREGCGAYGNFNLPDPAGRIGAENYAFKGQMVGAMQYRADGELWQRNKWDATQKFSTGWALWTVNNTFPEVCSRLYSYSLEPNASLFYIAHAQKPLHVQYDYFANDVSAVNNSFADARNLHVKVALRNLDWSLKWSATKDLSDLPEETTENGLLTVPAKETAGLDDVHFIDVQLFNEQNQKIDDMVYWRSKRDSQYGADGPFTPLQSMPSTTVQVVADVRVQGDRQVVLARLKNVGTNLAFFTRLKVYQAASQKFVDGSFYSDDYLAIQPGEERMVSIDYPVKNLGGEQPCLIVEGWNVAPLTIPLPGSGTTPPAKPSSPSENLARYRGVMASSGATTASFAVDGLSTTGWTPENTDSAWISVDLGDLQAINQVKLNWATTGFDHYKLQSSTDGRSWSDLIPDRHTSVVSESIPFSEHIVRYVKLTGNGGQAPTLNEFEIYGPPAQAYRVNLAQGKPASASSWDKSRGLKPEGAFDGNLNSRWGVADEAALNLNGQAFNPNNEWLSVDLGTPTSISEFRIDWEAAYATAYDIQTSNDASQWTTVYATEDGKGGTEDLKITPTQARYVRLVCRKRGSPYGYSIWEFKVFGPLTETHL